MKAGSILYKILTYVWSHKMRIMAYKNISRGKHNISHWLCNCFISVQIPKISISTGKNSLLLWREREGGGGSDLKYVQLSFCGKPACPATQVCSILWSIKTSNTPVLERRVQMFKWITFFRHIFKILRSLWFFALVGLFLNTRLWLFSSIVLNRFLF